MDSGECEAVTFGPLFCLSTLPLFQVLPTGPLSVIVTLRCAMSTISKLIFGFGNVCNTSTILAASVTAIQ